jgi:hypothetical protein
MFSRSIGAPAGWARPGIWLVNRRPGGIPMKHIDKETSRCLKSEKEQLVEDVRRCDFCSTNVEEHGQCYEEAARESGWRSKNCFD